MAVTVGNGVIAGPFTPNGVTTAFAFDFRVLKKEELSVYRGELDAWDEVSASLYDIVIDATEGGEVQFVVPPAAGEPLYIAATPLFDQGTGYGGGEAPFTPKSLNAEFDRAAMRAAVLKERADRALAVPRGVVPPSVGELESGKLLMLDGNTIVPSDGITPAVSAVLADIDASKEVSATYSGLAGVEADRAAGFAVALQVTTAGGWFDTVEAGAAAVAEGEGYIVITAEGRTIFAEKVDGVGVIRAELASIASMRTLGINILDIPSDEAAGLPGLGDGGDQTDRIQTAIDLAAALGVSQVNFPGKGWTFLIEGDALVYGIKRGVIEMKSGVSLIGKGATIKLSGGRTDPGGLFYWPFWEGDPLEDVTISGLDLDGNLSAQSVGPYPQYTGDGDVWQHGHAIATGYGINLRVSHCTIHGWRGNGISFFTDENGDPSLVSQGKLSRGLRVHDCTFYDNFAQDIGGNGADIFIYRNRFVDGDHPSRWVAAVDLEIGVADTQLSSAHVLNNLFDFREGWSVPERTLQHFDTDSEDAEDARTHLRRAVSIGFFFDGWPDATYDELLRDVRVCDNVVYQGTIDCYNFANVEISRNHVYNSFEDVTLHTLQPDHAIRVGPGAGGNDVTGLRNARVRDNIIESDLAGYGIYFSVFDAVSVGGNVVKFSRKGGLRLESSSGIVDPNIFIDTGSVRTPEELDPEEEFGDPSLSCGIVIFGGQSNPLTIARQTFIDTRQPVDEEDLTEPGMRYGIYANIDADPVTVIDMPVCQGLIDGPLNDINGNAVWAGFVGSAWHTDAAVQTGTLTVLGDATVGKTTGDTTLTIRGGVGSNRKLHFSDTGGIEYQIAQLASGALALMNFSGGSFQRTDIEIGTTGKVMFQGVFGAPILLDTARLWSNAGVIYTNTADPANAGDGTILGTQA